jgi:hypothetical protein
MNSDPVNFRANPLSAWFLLTTAAAVLVALILGAVRGSEASNGWGIGLAIVFPCVLTLFGFFKRPRLRNAFLGAFCGVVVGLAAGTLVGSGPVGLTSVSATVLVGSLILALVGLAGRTAR